MSCFSCEGLGVFVLYFELRVLTGNVDAEELRMGEVMNS